MMKLVRSPMFIMCLLHNHFAKASFGSFFKSGFEELSRVAYPKTIENGLDLPLIGDEMVEAQETNQTSTSRRLQDTELVLSATYVSQLNRSYAFPQSLDTDCAVGPVLAVGVSHFHVEALDTVTGEPVFASSLRWLFNSLLPADLIPVDAEMTNPRVIYNSVASRYIISTTMTDKEKYSRLFLAFSRFDDPRSGTDMDWAPVAIDLFDAVNGQSVWAKDINMAADNLNLYITATMYTTTPETVDDEAIDTFVESRVWVINVPQVEQIFNNPTAQMTALNGKLGQNFPVSFITEALSLSVSSGGTKLGPYQPTADAVGSGAYLIAHNDQNIIDTEVHIISLVPTGAASVSTTESMVSLGSIDDLTVPIPPAAQPNFDYSPIRTGDRRVADAVFQKDGTDKFIHMTTTIEDSDESGVYWATIDLSSMAVVDFGSILGDDISPFTSTFYPSIAVSGSGEVVVGFAASGEGVFAGMYASKATKVESGAVTIKGGEDSYESLDGFTYHGEYSGLVADPDPNNDGCFWTFNTFSVLSDPIEAALLIQTWARGAVGAQWGKVCLEATTP